MLNENQFDFQLIFLKCLAAGIQRWNADTVLFKIALPETRGSYLRPPQKKPMK